MGANFFTAQGRHENPASAFTLARDDASWESGNGGYTGTVAEKDSYRITDTAVRWVDDARAWASEVDLSHHDKWGPAEAIPYAERRAGEEATVRTVTVDVRVDGVSADSILPVEVQKAARANVTLAAGETARSVDVVNVSATYRTSVRRTRGERVVRYVVAGVDGFGHDTWETGYATQGEATAAVVAHLEQRDGRKLPRYAVPRGEEFSVEAVTRRADGSPLSVVRHELVSVVYTADVKVQFSPPAPARIDGWLFFGYASS